LPGERSSWHVSFLDTSDSERRAFHAQGQRESKTRARDSLGRIKAAIWENETQNGTMYNVTVCRLYRDGKQWRDSASFGRDDLPLLAKVADRVHSWIFDQSQEQNGSSKHDADDSSQEDF
jgi:hypothetical protein